MLFFIAVSCTQVSTTNGFPTIGFPLVFVLTVNALKDAYEDWRRHKADEEENNQPCLAVMPTMDDAASVPVRPKWDAKSSQALPDNDDGGPSPFEMALIKEDVAGNVGDDFDVKQSTTFVAEEGPEVIRRTEQLIERRVLVQISWKNLAVGDAILCRNGDKFPAGKAFAKRHAAGYLDIVLRKSRW